MANLNDYLLYHYDLAPRLSDFGFDIPLEDSRSDQVFKGLKKKFDSLEPVNIDEVTPYSESDLRLVHSDNFFEGLNANELLRVYGVEYPYFDFRYVAFWKSVLLQGGGTYLAMKKALGSSFCYFLGGGMHHASTHQGDGFCPINDIVIGLRKLQNEKHINKALVIDIDAHKGDGTAEVTRDDHLIDTVSIHMSDSWPLPDETPGAKVPSTLDIEIGENQEENYLSLLEQGLKKVSSEDYDLIIVVGGVDPYEGDELLSTQSLKLTKEQMLTRDLIVYKFAGSTPQTWLMSGGYGKESALLYEQFIEKVLYFVS